MIYSGGALTFKALSPDMWRRWCDDEEQINKKDGIVNKTFVEMLEKLGCDIQVTYVKKETH